MRRVGLSGVGITALVLFSRSGLAALPEPVLLRQSSPSPASLPSWPFVTGIPLRRCAVTDVSALRLVDGAGREVPAQFEALAHWSPARDSVKWLRVVFESAAVGGEAPDYRLETRQVGGTEPPPRIAPAIKVTEDAGGVSVDTGAIRFVLSRTAGGCLSSVSRGRSEVFRAGPLDGPYVVDQAGATYRAALDPVPSIVVEERGSLRVVVRVESWHVREGGGGPASQVRARLNKSIIRYYAYAGQPWIEVDWTFVVTADTDEVQFRDIGFRMAGKGPGRVGVEGAPARGVPLPEGYLLQKKADLYSVRRLDGRKCEEVASGGRAPGWIANRSFSLLLRDFWQTFPRELEAEKGAVVLHAWPAHGEYNDDWFVEPDPSPGPDVPIEQVGGPSGVKMSAAYFHQLQKFHHGPLLDFRFPEWWRGPNVAGDHTKDELNWLDRSVTAVGHRANEFFALWSTSRMPEQAPGGVVKEIATGTSRTQEMLLDFSGDPEPVLAARREMFLARPHVWLKEPRELEATGALGPIDVEVASAWLERSAESWRLADEGRHYGLWLFGNMPEYFNPDGSPSIFRMLGGGPHFGYFNNNWLLYMTTGRPDHLEFGRINTRQWRDVEIVHFSSPEFEKRPGGSSKLLGAANTVSTYPWRLGSVFGFYSGSLPLLYDYYLTGDRRSLGVAELNVAGSLRHADGRGYGRDHAGHLKTLVDWYGHGWDPAVARKIDEAVLFIVKNDPTAEKGKAGTLNWTNVLPRYLQLAADPASGLKHFDKVKAYVVEWANSETLGDVFATGYVVSPGNLLAAAWYATGEEKYLHPFMRNMLKYEIPRERWLVPAAPGLGSGTGAARFDEVLFAYSAWREAVQKGLVRGSEGDLPLPPPVTKYRTPVEGVYFGKESRTLLLKEAGKELKVEWGNHHPGAAVVLTGPDGRTVLETVLKDGAFTMAPLGVPADAPPGVYTLVMTTEPYMFWGSTVPHGRHVVQVSEPVAIFGGNDWVFMVPEGTTEFTAFASEGSFIVDPEWKKIRGAGDGKPVTIRVEPGKGGKLWRFRPVGHDSRLRLVGIPAYVAPHPDYWFRMP